jgi:hypothetical protein
MPRRSFRAPLALGLLVLPLAACGDPPAEPDAAAAPDAYVEPPDAGTDAARPGATLCEDLGLPRVAMREGTGPLLGDVATDFTVQTLGGPWHLAEEWSGYDSYVFFTYFEGATGDALFGTLGNGNLLRGPRNVHYFFSSFDTAAPEDRVARAEGLATQLESAFEGLALDESEREFWRSRMHFVTDAAEEIAGGPGEYLVEYVRFARTPEAIVDLGDRGMAGMPIPFVFGIDRAQTWDTGDDLSPSVGQNPTFTMGQFLPRYYNYRYALEQRLAAETDTTVVPIVDHERTTGRVFTRAVTLPSASVVSAFDTLEVDVEITCDERNLFACSEWDRIASVSLCVDGEACTDRQEIARWITPYWRRGRQHHVIDATPFLALLGDGGAHTFRVELGPDWERATEWVAHVALRMRTQGSRPHPSGALRAFTGGTFDATYNMRDPVPFTVPVGATRVELVTILSGHGQTDGDNCAEWCDHRHTFTVGDTMLPTITHAMNAPTGASSIGSARGCGEMADRGVIPGQGGNWAPTRAYWCPGMAVDAIRTDITSLVTPGVETTLGYRGAFRAIEPRGGDIALSTYVVWYE